MSLGYTVMHVSSATRAAPHLLQPPARVLRGELTYEAVSGDDPDS